MHIAFAILGYLNAAPHSGYDLKKLIAESESLPWSGNNNQVYSALVQLHRDGLAGLQVEQPAGGPARKVYSITEDGRQALLKWLHSPTDLPHFRMHILVQLLSADVLSADEFDSLLGAYAEELRLKIWSLEELQRRRTAGPRARSRRQAFLWETINERPLALHRAEEEWVRHLRWALAKLDTSVGR